MWMNAHLEHTIVDLCINVKILREVFVVCLSVVKIIKFWTLELGNAKYFLEK